MFNDGWKFKKLPDGTWLSETAFDTSDWEEVDLPHTWNAVDGCDGHAESVVESDGSTASADRDGNSYFRGLGGYVKEYIFSSGEYAGKKIYIEFEGANTVTTLYINGIMAGEPHRGGYARFRYDITDYVRLDEGNVITVIVDNSRTTDIAPLDGEGDFTKFGGIYRDVSVIAADLVHFDRMDYGSDGIYVSTPEVTKQSAAMGIMARVTNDSPKPRTVTVRAMLLDTERILVTCSEQEAEVDAGETLSISLPMQLEDPHLWNGIKDPYLYTLHVTLEAEGCQDGRTVSVGFRSFSLLREALLLNGEEYKVYGVNCHQDSYENGFAMTDEQRERDYAIMRDMGVTAVRMAHYQHDRYEYDICDRTGYVVWAEVPLINHVVVAGEPVPSKAFCDNIRQQLKELIRQNYNHPCILFWGIANELYDVTPETKDLFTQLCDIAKQEDPSRITIYADNVGSSETKSRSEAADAVGYNRYDGWYHPALGEMHLRVNRMMEADPRPACISEYGAGGATTHHMDNPGLEDINPNGVPHYEEYQAIYHEVLWSEITSMKLWGSFIWSMFDFASDSREEGDTKGQNDKGMVTRDRSIRKDVYYFYRSVWNEENMVYITGRRYTPRPVKMPEVKVYSNAVSVELFVNGSSCGTVEQAALEGDLKTVFKWQDIVLNAGEENEIKAVAVYSDGTAGEDVITLVGFR